MLIKFGHNDTGQPVYYLHFHSPFEQYDCTYNKKINKVQHSVCARNTTFIKYSTEGDISLK